MSEYPEGVYALPESLDPEAYLIGTYIFQAETADYFKFGGAVAIEQSTGSWVRLPQETAELVDAHGVRVIDVFEVPDHEFDSPAGERTFVLKLAFPIVNIGYQLPMLLNTVFGVVSLMGVVKMVDLELPKSYVEHFPGPQFGVDGMRAAARVPERPFFAGIIKPSVGLRPEQAGELFYQMALGGVDLIKDDEKMGEVSYSSVVERVKACMAAEERAFEETGGRTYYAVNITASPAQMLQNARAALDAGANMLMLSHLTVGIGALQDLVAAIDGAVPILTHPDFQGVLSRPPDFGLSSHLTIGKLPRLAGVDVSDFPMPYGSVRVAKEKYFKIALALQSPFHGLKRAWAQTGGAMHPGVIPQVVADLGCDVLLTAGGAVHAHPMGTRAGAAALGQAVEAVMAGRDLRDAAKEHKELAAAIDAWGIYGEESGV
ncbi:MAG: RuBisCO large subunit C-terminal-like domain-containing protein [Anaerolineae bacterium]|nr:RuBisCO large subunit C-terminal-like domain-containing protein [Anaerolineae bacterium]